MTASLQSSGRFADRLLRLGAALSCLLPLLVLVALLVSVVHDGAARLSWAFLTGMPSRRPEQAGVLPALVGSIWLLGIVGVVAVPLGVAAAVYLEEYAGDHWWNRFLELNIANLAGVPSVIYGLLGLEVFVRAVALGDSVLAGGLTLALLVLPIVIITAREAIRAVPASLRQAAYALGATRWRVVRHVVLPEALPGILTGSILALSRAIGEAAPLVVIGGLAFVAFVPDGLDAPFTALPIQIFNWVSRPQAGFHTNAAAAICVLLALLLAFNALAIGWRGFLERRRQG